MPNDVSRFFTKSTAATSSSDVGRFFTKSRTRPGFNFLLTSQGEFAGQQPAGELVGNRRELAESLRRSDIISNAQQILANIKSRPSRADALELESTVTDFDKPFTPAVSTAVAPRREEPARPKEIHTVEEPPDPYRFLSGPFLERRESSPGFKQAVINAIRKASRERPDLVGKKGVLLLGEAFGNLLQDEELPFEFVGNIGQMAESFIQALTPDEGRRVRGGSAGAEFVGDLAALAVPFTKGFQAANFLLRGIKNPVVKQFLRGSGLLGTFEGIEKGAQFGRGEISGEDAIISTLIAAGIGGVGDVALFTGGPATIRGIRKVFSRDKTQQALDDAFKAVGSPVIFPEATPKPKTLSSKSDISPVPQGGKPIEQMTQSEFAEHIMSNGRGLEGLSLKKLNTIAEDLTADVFGAGGIPIGSGVTNSKAVLAKRIRSALKKIETVEPNVEHGVLLEEAVSSGQFTVAEATKLSKGELFHRVRGNIHEKFVRKALARGEKIPPEVLAQYPHLKPKPAPVTSAGLVKLDVGYSTHGRWVDAKTILEIELERGNFIPDELRRAAKEGKQAIWATEKPKDAVRYLRSAEEFESGVAPTADELGQLTKVDLRVARNILGDGDGGFLFVRSKPGPPSPIKQTTKVPVKVVSEKTKTPEITKKTDEVGKLKEAIKIEPDKKVVVTKIDPDSKLAKAGKIDIRKVTLTPVDKIRIDLKRFQGREEEFAIESAESVAKDFNPNSFEPIVVLQEADGPVIVSGHSRYNAAKKAGIKEIPTVDFTGDPNSKLSLSDQAVEFARNLSNFVTTGEGFKSALGLFNRLTKEGKTTADIGRRLKSDAKATFFKDISNLDPKGKMLEQLTALESGEKAEGFAKLKSWSRFVGKLRKQFPELTNRHEDEIFNWLYKGEKTKTPNWAQSQEVLDDLIQNAVNRFDFDSSAPLNIAKKIVITGARATSNTSSLVAKIEELNSRIRVAKTIEEKTALGKELIKVREGLADVQKRQTTLFGAAAVSLATLDAEINQGEVDRVEINIGRGVVALAGFFALRGKSRALKSMFQKSIDAVKSGGVLAGIKELSARARNIGASVNPLGSAGSKINHTTTGRGFMRGMFTMQERAHNISGKGMQMLSDAGIGSLDEAGGIAVGRAMEAGKAPKYKAAMDWIFSQAEKAGVPVAGFVKNYFPRMMKREVAEDLFQNTEDFLRRMESDISVAVDTKSLVKIAENYLKTKHAGQNLRDAVDDLVTSGEALDAFQAFAKIKSDAGRDLFRPFGNLERRRKSKYRQGFFEDDARIVLARYMRSAGERISREEVWGPGFRREPMSQLEVFRSDVTKFVEQPTKLENILARLRREDPESADIARLLVDMSTGKIEQSATHGLSPKFRTLVDGLTGFQVGTKIGAGFATLLNVTQTLISTFPKAGWIRGFKGIVRLADPEVRKRVRESGAVLDQVILALTGQEAEGLMGRFASKVTKFSGFQGINRVNQYIAASTAELFVNDLHKIANSGVTLVRRKWAQQRLRDVAIDWRKPLKDDDVLRYMFRFANDSQLQKNILRDPLAFNMPRLRHLFLFKRFGYRQVLFAKDELFKEVTQGNALPILRLIAGGYAGGEFIVWGTSAVKNALTGQDYYYRRTDHFTLDRALENLAAVGSIGLLTDLVDASDAREFMNKLQFFAMPVTASDAITAWISLKSGIVTTADKGLEEGVRKVIDKGRRILGSLPSKALEGFKTEQQVKDKIEFFRGRERTILLEMIILGEHEAARKRMKLWNEHFPAFGFKQKDINAKAVNAFIKKRDRK